MKSISKSDVSFRPIEENGRCGVHAVHLPTGNEVIVKSAPSLHENRRLALKSLEASVDSKSDKSYLAVELNTGKGCSGLSIEEARSYVFDDIEKNSDLLDYYWIVAKVSDEWDSSLLLPGER